MNNNVNAELSVCVNIDYIDSQLLNHLKFIIAYPIVVYLIIGNLSQSF